MGKSSASSPSSQDPRQRHPWTLAASTSTARRSSSRMRIRSKTTIAAAAVAAAAAAVGAGLPLRGTPAQRRLLPPMLPTTAPTRATRMATLHLRQPRQATAATRLMPTAATRNRPTVRRRRPTATLSRRMAIRLQEPTPHQEPTPPLDPHREPMPLPRTRRERTRGQIRMGGLIKCSAALRRAHLQPSSPCADSGSGCRLRRVSARSSV
mmetsp:Transcript_13130/g.35961  ORF Transcript_13130/g.35961 Transcript_13130/m.35961 type:complete len:209 (+) Transcript_13130:616-1242(+)